MKYLNEERRTEKEKENKKRDENGNVDEHTILQNCTSRLLLKAFSFAQLSFIPMFHLWHQQRLHLLHRSQRTLTCVCMHTFGYNTNQEHFIYRNPFERKMLKQIQFFRSVKANIP